MFLPFFSDDTIIHKSTGCSTLEGNSFNWYNLTRLVILCSEDNCNKMVYINFEKPLELHESFIINSPPKQVMCHHGKNYFRTRSRKYSLERLSFGWNYITLQADSLFKEQIPHAESLSAKVELVKVQLAKLPTQRKWHIPTQKHPLFYWSFVSMSTHKLEFSLQFVPLASILIISLKAKLPVL